jgi:hypothetical protein
MRRMKPLKPLRGGWVGGDILVRCLKSGIVGVVGTRKKWMN